MIGLSGRLKMVAGMVRKGAVCADIGTDHAYLCVYLIQNGICPRAVAADLREMPLKNAESAVKLCDLSDKIALRLSDGLDEIKPDEADDIVLAGMGGTLIVELLERTDWLKGKRIIVQPMTHSENVRRFFSQNRFEILGEDACFDDGRGYIAFYAEYNDNCKPPASEKYFYTGGFENIDSDAARAYVKKQKNLVMARLNGLNKANIDNEEAKLLRKVISDWDNK